LATLEIASLLIAASLSLFKGQSRLQAEYVVLRHQLNVLRRFTPRRGHLTNVDRVLFVWVYRVWPGVLRSVAILRPETVVRWHREGFRTYWRWRSRRSPGRPRTGEDVRDLIRCMSLANPLWGAPRIHGEILKLGIVVAQSTVAKYMPRGRRPPTQSWRTFLRNHTDGIASIDLFVVPSITFKLLFAFVVLRHRRRQISDAFPWESVSDHLIRDRDRSYGEPFRKRLRAMGIRDHPIAPRSPWQNGHVARLIGSIQRECLDHLIIINAAHLRRVLSAYAHYYNRARTHLALGRTCHSDEPFSASARSRPNRISAACTIHSCESDKW
jgi:transposase InsO family protein